MKAAPFVVCVFGVAVVLAIVACDDGGAGAGFGNLASKIPPGALTANNPLPPGATGSLPPNTGPASGSSSTDNTGLQPNASGGVATTSALPNQGSVAGGIPSGSISIPAGTGGTATDTGSSQPTVFGTPIPIAAKTPIPGPLPAIISVEVTLTPANPTIHLPAPDGINAAGYATTVQLEASVLMNNLTKTTGVTWGSSDATIANVNATGLVSAGTKPGLATITATAKDGKSSGIVQVSVKATAALDAAIE